MVAQQEPSIRPADPRAVAEWVNALTAADALEADLRRIVRDGAEPATKREAGQIMLWMLAPNMADYEPLLDGTMTVEQLAAAGVDTTAIKHFAVTTEDGPAGGHSVTREIELHDRSGDACDWVADNCNGD